MSDATARPSTRLALGVVLAAVAVAGVAALSSGRHDDSGAGASVPRDLLRSIFDTGSFAFMTVGFALLIAVFILQFGIAGDREERARRRPFRLFVVALALLLLAPPLLGAVGDWLRDQEQPPTEEEPPLADLSNRTGTDDAASSGSAGEAATGIGLGLLVTAAVAAWLWSGRQRHPLGDEADPDAELAATRDRVHLLLDEAISMLRAHPDPREAVIATWSRLEVAFAAAGWPRHAAEAPRPYIERVLAGVRTSAPVARRLAVSFERAMFSPHAIDRAAQDEAVDALVAVRDELAVGSDR